jgi:hypothetical protein
MEVVFQLSILLPAILNQDLITGKRQNRRPICLNLKHISLNSFLFDFFKMLLTAANLVLLNALLSAALPHPGFIPKIPNAPNVPNTPNIPNGGFTPDVPNLNNPNQAVPEPGRWPPETQTPDTQVTPDTPDTPNTPNNPNTPNDPNAAIPNQQPDISSCIINGKKRAACTPNDSKWNALPVREGQTENQFSIAGRTAIARLDNVKNDPPPVKNVQTQGVMDSRYVVTERVGTNAESPNILRVVKGMDPNDQSW